MGVQYRVQFLDDFANVVREMHSYAPGVGSLVDLLAVIDWPPISVEAIILGSDGREIHSQRRRRLKRVFAFQEANGR
jgi:hypothetical protein